MAHYLVTGHTGFKGSWLTLLLKYRGHTVSGLALDPQKGGLFDRASLGADLEHDLRLDIRDQDAVLRAFQSVKPDAVVHMAAQALVREGYRDPQGTYETNVNGTLNVLRASDATASIESQLIVTTDKVYRDDGLGRPYLESDPLGGADPYSSSKAMADLLAQEFMRNGRTKPGAIVRAGNVIGAGDVSTDRLIPDIIRANQNATDLEIRYPKAIRPWQHVYDCLAGYLAVLLSASPSSAGDQWNVGPLEAGAWTVVDVVDAAGSRGSAVRRRTVDPDPDAVEANCLELDSSKIRQELRWSPKMNAEAAISEALAELDQQSDADLRLLVEKQISAFESL